MKSFAEALREDRRLVMLRLLSEQPGYRLNSSNLHAGLSHLAIAASRAEVGADLEWLSSQGMLRLREVNEAPGLYIAELTALGQEVAQGREHWAGIGKPHAR